MTPAQCRGGRGLLDWTQKKLADAAGVRRSAVSSFELSWRAPAPETIHAMQRALEAAGIEFIDENGSGAGVKFRKGKLN